MKTETKLNKLLAMEDSVKKRMKLFEFMMTWGMPGTTYRQKAFEEWSRLNKITF